MGTTVRQSTSQSTPDAGFGGSAVTGQSATGHSSTTSACNSFAGLGGSDSDSQTKSARWGNFTNVTGGITQVRLKFDWSASGSGSASSDDGTATVTIDFDIEYSVNNGSNWTSVIHAESIGSPGVPASLTNNNSANISLSVGQDLTQVFVRDRVRSQTTANGGIESTASATGTISLTVSSIQVEVTTSEGNSVLIGGS